MFAENLKRLRKGKGYTQVSFAKSFHVSNGTIAMWETGKREPDLKTVQRLAEFFGCTLDDIFGQPGDPTPHNTEEDSPRELSDKDIMFGLMNGDVDEITDEIFGEVKAYAKFRAEQKRREKSGT